MKHIGLMVGVLLCGLNTAVAISLLSAPCAGIRVDGDLSQILIELEREPRLTDDARLFFALTVPLDRTAVRLSVDSIRTAGATPWIRAVFQTPHPISDNLVQFESELDELIRLLGELGRGEIFIQAVWLPEEGSIDPVDHAFLLKKAAVAVTGAAPDSAFVAGPLPADSGSLVALYEEDVAAYLDLVAFAPGEELPQALSALGSLDPGKPVVLDALAWPKNPTSALVEVAEFSSAGILVTFFRDVPSEGIDLAPLKVLAREFHGNLVVDRWSVPSGAQRAWSFVREDLDLRVVVVPASGDKELELIFADTQLRAPAEVDLSTGESRIVRDIQRNRSGLVLRVHDPAEVMLLRLERPSIEELEAFDESVDVSGDRQIPVEEILRRLQAFEDSQNRRLQHYQAERTLHLRFQAAQGSFEASYAGDFFFLQNRGFDWVWKEFSVGGVKWRSKKLPEVPLIQPEKAASLPVEIRLTKDYEYRLRGSAVIDDRDCWVIDFKPVDAVPGRSLFRGTVWVDREIYARVRSRATQVGLVGSVMSNEETRFYSPLDDSGRPAAWSGKSYVLPLRISGQRNLSILSVTLPVEHETVVENIGINNADFEHNREAALASDMTMVRDTEDGVRYLRKDKSGKRFAETKVDSTRLFLIGGVFWDESLDYPIPLAGVNYLDLDLGSTGAQFDLFFAGAFLNAGVSDPDLFGSRWNGGANFNGLFIKTTDELYRDSVVAEEENVRSRSSSASLFFGRPLGKFLSFELTYGLRKTDFYRADDTGEELIIPVDTLTHMLRTSVEYNRAGYRIRFAGDVNRRDDWQFWGLPENDEYHSDQKEYQRWRAVFAKTWFLQKYRRISFSLEHLNGANLDRFSGYDFGLLGNSVVAGYPSGLVRAEKADGAHLSYGVNYFEKIRFDLRGDAVWATNRATGLDRELLAGIGLEGTTTLPWQLILNFEAGYALAGPGKCGIALRVFFLKLFPGQ